MTATHAGTKPDVDLTDGNFFADGGARAAYRWMRANEPVFRDRNGLAAAATYQAVLDAERNPELFSSAGGIRPDSPAMPYMIDMDDPAHLLRRKLVNSGFTRKRVTDKAAGIDTLCDTLIDAVCERGECDFVHDLAAPHYGDAVTIRAGEVPVLWACGVTPQAALARARLPLAITHAPGCMLVTSLTNAQLAGAAELAPVPGSLV